MRAIEVSLFRVDHFYEKLLVCTKGLNAWKVSLSSTYDYYHPRIRVGNVFSRVCLSVCLSVSLSICLSMCISVQAITFELLHIETSFLVYRYIFTISSSSLSIKVIGSRSWSNEKNDNFTYFHMFILCLLLKVKVTHQDQGQDQSQGQGQMRKIIISFISTHKRYCKNKGA